MGPVTLFQPSWCQDCGKFLAGLTNQGQKCRFCDKIVCPECSCSPSCLCGKHIAAVTGRGADSETPAASTQHVSVAPGAVAPAAAVAMPVAVAMPMPAAKLEAPTQQCMPPGVPEGSALVSKKCIGPKTHCTAWCCCCCMGPCSLAFYACPLDQKNIYRAPDGS